MTKHPTQSTSALWARFRFSVVGALFERTAGAENSKPPWSPCLPRRGGIR